MKFAQERAKFEGWLKVELIDILVQQGKEALPEENNLTDVSFDNVGIELKTVNTSFRFQNVVHKIKPITDNVNGILKDIEKLQTSDFSDKFILFVVFPATHDQFLDYYDRIVRTLGSELLRKDFNFGGNGNIPGVIYYGQVH